MRCTFWNMFASNDGSSPSNEKKEIMFLSQINCSQISPELMKKTGCQDCNLGDDTDVSEHEIVEEKNLVGFVVLQIKA